MSEHTLTWKLRKPVNGGNEHLAKTFTASNLRDALAKAAQAADVLTQHQLDDICAFELQPTSLLIMLLASKTTTVPAVYYEAAEAIDHKLNGPFVTALHKLI